MSDEVSGPPEFRIRVKKLDGLAKLPVRATPGSAGLDICSVEAVCLKPGEYKPVRTGLAMAVSPAFELQVRPRSGMAARHGVTVLNAPGTIDSDYRGEVKVLLVNHGDQEFWVNPGDKIAQLVVGLVHELPIAEVESLDDTSRGSGGFGSTGA